MMDKRRPDNLGRFSLKNLLSKTKFSASRRASLGSQTLPRPLQPVRRDGSSSAYGLLLAATRTPHLDFFLGR